jgi:hypothetical protein
VKAPFGEWSVSELSSTEREVPGKRNSWAEMRESRWIKLTRRRGVKHVSIFVAGSRHWVGLWNDHKWCYYRNRLAVHAPEESICFYSLTRNFYMLENDGLIPRHHSIWATRAW